MPRLPLVFGIALATAMAASAHSATVDGSLDPAYGPPLSVQTTQTTLKAFPYGQVDYSVSAELDAGYGYVADGVLYLFLAGNLSFWWSLEGTTEWDAVDIFIDSKNGGQNQLLSNNPTLDSSYDMKAMTGLTFDPGFDADYWFSMGSDANGYPRLFAFMAELPTAGGGAGTFLGTTLCGAPGTLMGGTNPFGIAATMNDSNTAGVSLGCGAASGAGVGSGIEWAIPLAAIGNPTGCIKVCAFLNRSDHAYVFNQVLGPLPPGTCDPGTPAGVNFATIPGEQYFTLCFGPTPARRVTWGSIKSIYR